MRQFLGSAMESGSVDQLILQCLVFRFLISFWIESLKFPGNTKQTNTLTFFNIISKQCYNLLSPRLISDSFKPKGQRLLVIHQSFSCLRSYLRVAAIPIILAITLIRLTELWGRAQREKRNEKSNYQNNSWIHPPF